MSILNDQANILHIKQLETRFSTRKGIVRAVDGVSFEVGKGQVGKGGIVRDHTLQQQCIKKIMEFSGRLGYSHREPFPSPVMGAKGNQEFFLYLSPGRDQR